MMKRLLKKQGFTMVELIVVVAIIGIMLGIVVPLMSTNSAREREARENARAFYSNVQELMIDEKLNNTALGGDYTLIYATVEPRPGVSTIPDVNVYTLGIDSIPGGYISIGSPALINTGDPLEEFSNSLTKLLSANDQNFNVYYYAVVDDKFRVVYSYYSMGDYSEIRSMFFVGDCRVRGASGEQVWTGSYPYDKSKSGQFVSWTNF